MASLRIAHAYNIGTVVVMKSLLESEGIEVLDIARSGHLTIAGADQGYYVEVVPGQRDRAREILREHQFGKYILTDVSDPRNGSQR